VPYKRNAAEQVLASCADVVVTAASAWRQLLEIRVDKSQPVPTFRGTLDIGGIVKVPVYSYKLVSKGAPPSVKKRSTAAAEGSTGKVSMDRTYRLVAPPHDEIPPEDQAMVFPYGRDLFPASELDIEAMRSTDPACLKIIGFVSSATVNLSWLIGPSYVVAPAQPSSTGKYSSVPVTCGVSALVRAMNELSRVGVARFVNKDFAEPQLVLLIPFSSPDRSEDTIVGANDVFVMLRLPFAEDLRSYFFQPLEFPEEHSAQARVTKALIDSLDVSPSGGSAPAMPSTGVLKDLGPEPSRASASDMDTVHWPNPVIARFRDFIGQRAISSSAPVPPPPLLAACRLHIHPRVEERSKAAAVAFRDTFGLAARSAATMKKRVRAFGHGEGGPSLFEDGDSSSKRSKLVVGEDDLMLQGTSTGVGPVDPIGDFQRVVQRGDVEGAVSGMMKQIERLAREERGGSLARLCLGQLRQQCVLHRRATAFNDFLRALRVAATFVSASGLPFFGGGGGHELWASVKANPGGLGLISTVDSPDSEVSPSQALEFASDPSAPASSREASPVVLDEEDDEDELL
jgi:ATP-dependent DNA helicase 2 subunit 2